VTHSIAARRDRSANPSPRVPALGDNRLR